MKTNLEKLCLASKPVEREYKHIQYKLCKGSNNYTLTLWQFELDSVESQAKAYSYGIDVPVKYEYSLGIKTWSRENFTPRMPSHYVSLNEFQDLFDLINNLENFRRVENFLLNRSYINEESKEDLFNSLRKVYPKNLKRAV
ncbi:MAG: hypothetical protein ISS01_01290 [Nanoarchaeota archaeon]|nr:hypothetical protein [Nanoarchaeota archaeon]